MMYRTFPPFGSEFMKEFQQFREQLNELFKNIASGDVHLEDVKLLVKDNSLVLEGERKEPDMGQDVQKIRGEIAYGKFQRTLPLPENADLDKIRAEYKNGVLVVHIDKKEETKPRLIDVQVQ